MGYVITWVENGQDRWEFVETPEMLVYLYDTALQHCGIDQIYIFKSTILKIDAMKAFIKEARKGDW